MIKQLCISFMKRAEAQGYKRGLRRDKMAMEFFVGAASVIYAEKGEDSTEFQSLSRWMAFSLALLGYRAVEAEAARGGER